MTPNDLTGGYRKECGFVVSDIQPETAKNYMSGLFSFLKWLNGLHKKFGTPGVHNTERVTDDVINEYINTYLVDQGKSSETLDSHRSAIHSYYCLLHELGIKPDVPEAHIYPESRKKSHDNQDHEKTISYVTKSERSRLMRACNTKRDRLLLRLGFEVGLRAMENTGLELNDTQNRYQVQKGLLSLFRDLEKNKETFEYNLKGKYAKYGKSRLIYFSRALLTALKDYYETERAHVIAQSRCNDPDTLIISNTTTGKDAGKPISKRLATERFREIKRLSGIERHITDHALRHTFGTELYHNELLDENGKETRSGETALIVVQQRMGHANPETSLIYIRMRQQMLSMERYD